MKWFWIVSLFFSYTTACLAQSFNAGFVQGIWYKDETVFADSPTRIYVAVRNHTGADLTGVVEFFDNGERIERNNVSSLDGRIIESWTDWEPSYGEHVITATISKIELRNVGSSTEAIEVMSASSSDVIFVDYDTDKDGIGNNEDTDDDGDGIDDEEEIKNGTDPLVATVKTESEQEATESDGQTEERNSDTENKEDETNTDTSTTNATREGLERYLERGMIDSTLSLITKGVNGTKRRVDDYRAQRNGTPVTETETVTVFDNSTTSSITTSISTTGDTVSSYAKVADNLKLDINEVKETKSGEGGNGYLKMIIDIAKGIFSNLYTLILFLISLFFSNPIVVQITLLLLILYILYKTIKRFGEKRGY
ncbi:hypothetical protein KC865_01595 [Candidatus Kaiserbacteria bacterium]|nr:hypothetical protein [Candidatus Kaiserbacteria bacterium]